MSFIFGPVPSRRLGRSLGVDVIPAKTCTYDCIYCESGPTTRLTVNREPFWEPADILRELNEFVHIHHGEIDVITFSSAGEPTLYLQLGELIPAIKRAHPQYPLIVLTNGSLLWDSEVRRSLLKADRVVPSLDAITPSAFRRINRPHQSLDLGEIVEGIHAFRRQYKGLLHLEILLASGINDTPQELSALAETVDRIEPDVVELNTVVRPPAWAGAKGLSDEQMARAASCFRNQQVEIVGAFRAAKAESVQEDLASRVLQTIERRPCTVSELAASLGVPEQTLQLQTEQLERLGKLSILSYDGKLFLLPSK